MDDDRPRHWTSEDMSGDPDEADPPLPGRWPHAGYDETSASNEACDAGSSLSLPEAKLATRERASDLRSLLSTYVRRHWPATPEATSEPMPEPPRTTGTHARLLPVLRAVPWVLGAVFAFSFAWDFGGMTLPIVGTAVPLDGLLRIVSVSGLIGFATNWLAVTMLFQPRERRPIFGQGLIPAQRERVAFRLAEAVSEDLINEAVIKEKIEQSQIIPRYRQKVMTTTRAVIEDEAFRRDLKALITDYAEEMLGSEAVQRKIARFTVERLEDHAGEGLSGLALRVYRLFNEEDFQQPVSEAVQTLPTSLDIALDEIDRLLDRLPMLLASQSDELEEAVTRAVLRFVESINVYRIVREKMAAYDERQLEDLFKKTSNEQLNYIKYLGGVLGALGGLVIWNAPLALGAFSALGLVLVGLDVLLYRKRD